MDTDETSTLIRQVVQQSAPVLPREVVRQTMDLLRAGNNADIEQEVRTALLHLVHSGELRMLRDPRLSAPVLTLREEASA